MEEETVKTLRLSTSCKKKKEKKRKGIVEAN